MNNSSLHSLYQELNKPQHDAVMHTNGPLLVIAGAGSGKTRVITTRIVHLLVEHAMPAYSIIALTFTNKAAQEMRSRIAHTLGERISLPFIGTFHAYCLQLLKKYRHLIDIPFNSMLDADDQKKLIHDILKKNNLHKQFSGTTIAYQISLLKNKHFNAQEIEKNITNPIIYEIYAAYEAEKALSKCFDFDDLLVHTVRLFEKNESFRTEFQQTVRHILVDEYQDTNIIQNALLKLMALNNKNLGIDSLCAVGDEDQSIYSWRGAHVANIHNFSKEFPNTTIIKIEQNYRSVQPILDTANTIINNNNQRIPKQLWSERKAVNRLKALTCVSEYQEAEAIAQLSMITREHLQTKNCAVLYRTHSQSRSIEEALIKNSVPYVIVGGIQFYERKEIKDILAYLKLIINPHERTSLARVINTPSRGLGEKFEEQLHDYWSREPFLSFQEIIRHILNDAPLSPSKHASLNGFLYIFADITAQTTPSVAIEKIIKTTQYKTYIKDKHDKHDAEERLKNIDELVKAAVHFEHQGINTVSLFLDEVALLQEKNHATDHEERKVTLMTLHAAKGLEFDIVMLPGLEEQIIPSSRSIEQEESLEEERRLLYVGITRAREYVLMLHAQFRSLYGQTTSSLPSRFLDELPQDLITIESCSYWKPLQFNSYFKKWLNVAQHEDTVFTFGNYAAKIPLNKNDGATTHVFTNKYSSVKKTVIAPSKTKTVFKPFQPVRHNTYGIGIVQKEEIRADGSVCVIVKFKEGVKKIIASFLTAA